MALITCHECGKEISSEALTCPHCGAPSKRGEKLQELEEKNAVSGKIGRVMLGIILILIGIALLYSGAFGIGYGGW